MKENKMIIRPVNTKVIHVHDDDQFWTVVRSYRNYDGIEPVYTIIQEDAHASPVIVQTNKKASAVNEYFGHNIITFFDEEHEYGITDLMRIPKTDIVDLDEYKILIEYDGDGGLDITVLDELGEEIEGLYISNLDLDDDISNDLDINLN